MRWILRQFLFHLIALIGTSRIIPGFSIGSSYEAIGLATLALALINVFIKPIVKILFLPLNLITLNLFSIVINIGVVFALTKLVSTVTISAWQFAGVKAYGYVIPAMQFTVIYTYVVVAVILTFIVSFLNWLTK